MSSAVAPGGCAVPVVAGAPDGKAAARRAARHGAAVPLAPPARAGGTAPTTFQARRQPGGTSEPSLVRRAPPSAEPLNSDQRGGRLIYDQISAPPAEDSKREEAALLFRMRP